MDFKRRVEAANRKLIIITLEKVLGTFMESYLKNDLVVPVVVGGSNLRRCALSAETSKVLINKLKLNDIDIKFIVKPKLREEDPLFTNIETIRRDFIHKLITHPLFIEAIKTVELKYGLKILSDVYTKYADGIVQDSDPAWMKRVYRVRLVKMNLVYQDPKTAEQDRVDFMDTTIISNLSEAIVYRMYQTVFKHQSLATKEVSVPIYVHNGVIYATCTWNYLDTVRMLFYYSTVFDNKLPKDENGNVYLLINMKYMVKFIIMYIQLNKIKNDDPKMIALKQIFRKGKQVLQDLLIKQLNRTEDTEVDHRLLGIIRVLKTSLSNHTNLETLVKAFHKKKCNKLQTVLNSKRKRC